MIITTGMPDRVWGHVRELIFTGIARHKTAHYQSGCRLLRDVRPSAGWLSTSALAAFARTPALDTHNLKRAAVAIALVESEDGSGETAFVLNETRARLALPQGDNTRCRVGAARKARPAIAAVLRQIREKLGLSPGAGDPLVMLDDCLAPRAYLITPVVIWAEQTRPLLSPNPEEVASVHRIPLAEIARADAIHFIHDSGKRADEFIRIRMNNSLVHAPTAAVIYQFHELLAGRHTRVGDLEQPVFAWR